MVDDSPTVEVGYKVLDFVAVFSAMSCSRFLSIVGAPHTSPVLSQADLPPSHRVDSTRGEDHSAKDFVTPSIELVP